MNDQAVFKTSWSANSVSSARPPSIPLRRQTSQAATAIAKYNAVQTGPKSQLGGVHDGFRRPAYHLGISGLVATEPRPAAAKQITTNRSSASHSLLLTALTLCCSIIHHLGFGRTSCNCLSTNTTVAMTNPPDAVNRVARLAVWAAWPVLGKPSG